MKKKLSAMRFDKKFVQLYLSGDHEAEKWLYDNLRQLISRMLQMMKPKGIIFSDVENVISEIIYNIMLANEKKVLRSYLGQCKLSTYLWRVVRNQIIDAYRKEIRVKDKEQLSEQIESGKGDERERLSDVEVIIEEHIADIPPLERYVKISKWVEGLSYEQIIDNARHEFSGKFSLTNSRIAYILFNNRKVLQKKLEKYVVK